jgi:HEAT repeat protein
VQEAIPKLIALLQDNNSTVRGNAATALATLQVQEAIPKLIALLEDNYSTVRSSAATALATLQVQEAIPKLIALLEDNNSDVRSNAATALGRLQAQEAIPKLLQWLKEGKQEEVVAIALSRMRQSSSELTQWQHQQQRFLNKQFTKHLINKETLARQLGAIYTESAVKQLVDLLNDKKIHVIKSAIESLGNIGAYYPQWLPTSLPQLIQLSKNQHPTIKIASIKALGQLIAFKATNPTKDLSELRQTVFTSLSSLAIDPQQTNTVRLHALKALKDSENPQLTPLLFSWLNHEQQTILHVSLYQWLGTINHPPALKLLNQHLHTLTLKKQQWRTERDNRSHQSAADSAIINTKKEDNSWKQEHIEFAIAYAITQINPTGSIGLLNHPLYRVRQATIQALASKANGELIKQLLNYHQDFDEKDLPSPRPYATYQALDQALKHLEDSGNSNDLNSLKQCQVDPRLTIPPKNKQQPSPMEQQRDAINQRLDWTLTELENRLGKTKSLN